jgi:hypothetical protein
MASYVQYLTVDGEHVSLRKKKEVCAEAGAELKLAENEFQKNDVKKKEEGEGRGHI